MPVAGGDCQPEAFRFDGMKVLIDAVEGTA